VSVVAVASRRLQLSSMKRIAIIGGGISGLAAAFSVEEQILAGVPLEYVLFESSPRFGGVIATERVENCLVEAGPDSFLTEKPWAADLCRRLGLADQLIGSNDAQRQTYILVSRKLVTIPDGLMFMVPTKVMPALLSPLFSFRSKLQMAREWFHTSNPANVDETVASFVERHYGTEMVERLADPLLSGIYGGDASQLSMRAVLPRFLEMEAKHGSLSRGMMAARRKTAPNSARPLFTSLNNGMQQMVDALVARLTPSALRLNCPVKSMRPQENGWLVSAPDESYGFDAVIVATPAHIAARLLQDASSDLSAELGAIPHSSSVTVTLGYEQNVRTMLPPGFGFLVPRKESKRLLAATFVHTKFSHRAPEGRALIRGFLGGSRDQQILTSSDEEIVRIVREELKQILSLAAEPLFTRVYRWNAAMAQYTVGHLERLERIQHFSRALPGLALAGNGYFGIGVPDCVRSGMEAATTLAGQLLP
jgi:protoporphyrinogen/coproporphyrinogen III oxidase